MQIIRGIDRLTEFLESNSVGCLADTGFLYAFADTDDRLNEKSLEVFEAFEHFEVPIHVNVISRMEFVDLVFRKQLTIGAIQTFKAMKAATAPREFFNLLKSISIENAGQLGDGQSYKMPEGKLKKLRAQLESLSEDGWKTFCKQYAGEKLSNEWAILEEDLGLKFIEVMEGQTSDVIEQPLYWKDMVQVMGREGLRGSDAMIANLFVKSRLPLLVTTDGDIVESFDYEDLDHNNKFVFHLE